MDVLVHLAREDNFTGLSKPLTLKDLADKPNKAKPSLQEEINRIYQTIDNPVDRTIAVMRLPSGK